MAPNGNLKRPTGTTSTTDRNIGLDEEPTEAPITIAQEDIPESYGSLRLKKSMIASMTILHLLALYTIYEGHRINKLICYNSLYCYVLAYVAGFGVTAGAHRYWAHKSYKARLPLRLFLAACFSMAGQNTIPQWVRDHRVHHKYSETIADPHNSNRGFFFAHMGWLMQQKHPAVIAKGNTVDMSDILNDPLVQFHTKYFIPLKILLCFVVPMSISYYVFEESVKVCFLSHILRYTCGLHYTWLVNSAAHLYGYHPYNNKIVPAENYAVSFLTMGEGWHNYHHVFPWDYKAADLGHTYLNLTRFFIDTFAFFGLAYDLKAPSQELVAKIAKKYGDGSYIPKEVDENGKEVH